MEPTTSEIARDLRQLEQRVERERVELMAEVRRGFSELRTAIDAQSAERITRDVYQADQKRFESEIQSLRRDVHSMRRTVIGSFFTVIFAAIVIQLIVA